RLDAVHALGCAETLVGEWQIGGDIEHDGIRQRGGALMELAHRLRADAGIDAREDVQELLLAAEIGKRLISEIRARKPKVRSLGTHCRQRPAGVDWLSLERHCRHAASPSHRAASAARKACWKRWLKPSLTAQAAARLRPAGRNGRHRGADALPVIPLVRW